MTTRTHEHISLRTLTPLFYSVRKLSKDDCPHCGSSLKERVLKTKDVTEIRCGICNELLAVDVTTHTQARAQVKSEPHKGQK